MKIVLTTLNSKYTHTSLALRLIGNWINAHGHEATWQEYTINTPIYNIVGDLHRSRPDILVFSVYIWNGQLTRQIAAQIKKLLPKTIIVFGGPEVSFDALGEMTRNPFVDYVVKGEGEGSLLSLVELLKEAHTKGLAVPPENLNQISGLTYRTENNIFDLPITETFDMDKLVFPYPDLDQLSDRILYYESSRGCPFNCSYCLSSSTKGVRFRDISLVKEDLTRFIQSGVRQVKWIDRTFNANPNRALELWKFLAEMDRGYTNFHFEITAELLREEDLAFLATVRPGLFQFEIGVQTTMEEAGAAVNRRLSFDKLEKPVTQMQSWDNIHVHLDLIAGLPHESFERFLQSFNQVYSLNPQVLQLGFLKLIKGSGIRNQAEQFGYIYEDYAPYEVLANNFISFDELLKLKDFEECLEHLHNSKRFKITLKELLKCYSQPSDFYMSLSHWLRNEGHFNEAIKTDKWFNLVYQFGIEKLSSKIESQNIAVCLLIDYMASMGRTAPEWLCEVLALTDVKAQVFELVKGQSFNDQFKHLADQSPKEKVKKIRYTGCTAPQTIFTEHFEVEKIIIDLESETEGILVVDPYNRHPVLERYPIYYYSKR